MFSLIFSRIVGILLGMLAVYAFFSLIKLHKVFYVIGIIVFNLLMMFVIIPMLKDQDFMADRKAGIKEWMSYRPVTQIVKPAIILESKPQLPEPAYTPPAQKEPVKKEEVLNEPWYEPGIVVQTIPFIKYKKVFELPADNNLTTGNWHLPENPDGWKIEVRYTGNFRWYMVDNSMDDYKDFIKGEKTDIGHNLETLNFCFSNRSEQEETVTLLYWSK